MSIKSHQKSYQLTRIAPTPSGFLHLGNAFSFALTASLAKQWGAGLLLRIDDMDMDRVSREYIGDIFDTLRFLDIPWTAGPQDPSDFSSLWSQRGRLHLYDEALSYLRSERLVYACKCSRRERSEAGTAGCTGDCRAGIVDMDAPGVSWRLRTNSEVAVNMIVPGGVSAQRLPAGMQDFIVRRRDGLPAYHLCSAVDDAHFGVDMVVRGRDLFDSTIAQLYLAGLLGLEQVTHACFVHHKLLCASSGDKLSKSAGDTSVQYLRKNGSGPQEVYKLMAQMAGISPVTHWSELAGIDLEAMM